LVASNPGDFLVRARSVLITPGAAR
jgi:hypothetical protein